MYRYIIFLKRLNTLLQKNISLKIKINRFRVYLYFLTDKRRFGKFQPYQSLEINGLQGQRNTEKRLQQYPLEYINSPKMVLDLGCNMGCLTISLSMEDKYKETNFVGIDVDSEMIEIAKLLSALSPHKSIKFYNESLDDFKKNNNLKFDFIMALAVDFWVGDDIDVFIDKLDELSNRDTKILLESNNLAHENIIQRWERLKLQIEKRKKIIKSGIVFDDVKREYLLYSSA